MVVAKQLSSMILYGPPGTGKTSIASAISGSTKVAFGQLNAATDTKKTYKSWLKKQRCLVASFYYSMKFTDSIKRNKTSYCPHLENGRIILVGATTENPYISINPAIRSRTQIFELKPLSSQDIKSARQSHRRRRSRSRQTRFRRHRRSINSLCKQYKRRRQKRPKRTRTSR